MDTTFDQSLADWVRGQAEASQQKLYFTINGDIPLTNNEGGAIYYLVPVKGKMVCVLHPEHLTRVAQLCYDSGIQMVQVLL